MKIYFHRDEKKNQTNKLAESKAYAGEYLYLCPIDR